ncbi:MAG TPA: phospholipid carrier-dependent glycosyltransferase, partial [Dongiaceae bacterium]|nr:phospholipid carrier-dependent glycosyltransferase [Dongiaceae bacterium]
MKLAAAAYSAGLLAFGGALVWSYFSAALQAGLVATVFLVGFACVAAAAGRAVLRHAGPAGLGELEKNVVGATLGLGLLATTVFALAALGLLRPWAIALALVLSIALSFSDLRDMIAAFRPREPGLAGAALGLLLALALWTAWVPPHQYDALVYHLPLPAAYLRTGRLLNLEHLIYSHFPQNAEMLFALGLSTGSELLPQLLSWFATALSVGWVFTQAKGRVSPKTAWLASLIVASHASVMILAGTAYVEAFVMLWLTAAVLSWVRGIETQEARGRRAWLMLAGVFAGLAVGTKYTAGICAASLAIFSLVRWMQKKADESEPLLFAIPAAICGAPWLIKNWILLGNPVFPFLFRQLPHRGVAWGAENADRYFHFLTEYGHQPGHFWSDLLSLPYRASFGAVNLGGGMDVIGTLGWAVLFALMPLAAWAAIRDRKLGWIGLYCLIHSTVWFSTVVVLRFLTAIVPLVALVGAAGFFRLTEMAGSRAKPALWAGLGTLLACNLALFLCVHTIVSSWRPLLGLESREAFLSRMLDYYPCASWA